MGTRQHVGPWVYDEAKRFQEAITMAYHTFHGLETRIVRIFNTYGPRMRLNDGRVLCLHWPSPPRLAHDGVWRRLSNP